MYPGDREVPEDLLQELLGILVHAGVGTSMVEQALNAVSLMSNPDCMTSPNSTAPYSEGDLKKLLGYVKHLAFVGGNYGFSACIVGKPSITSPVEIFSRDLSGRLMSFFCALLFVDDWALGG